MLGIVLFLASFYAVSAAGVPPHLQRIVGGSPVPITSYPFAASILRSKDNVTFSQTCVGSIINARSILTAASCFFGDNNSTWRIRVGSSLASSGGSIHKVQQIIFHPYYNPSVLDSDIAIVRSATTFVYNNSVRAGVISGINYVLNDNQPVWAIGWGSTYFGGPPSNQLQHVQIWSINQAVCANRYRDMGYVVTGNMLCAGWLDVGGRDQCTNDVGAPLLHNDVIVGIASWGYQCGTATFPGVNTRVSRFTPWIQANA